MSSALPSDAVPRLQRAMLRRLSIFSEFFGQKRPERSADSPTSPRNMIAIRRLVETAPQTPVDAEQDAKGRQR